MADAASPMAASPMAASPMAASPMAASPMAASPMVASPLLLHQLLEEQAARTPANTALEFSSSVRMTYQELNEISNRLARYIKAHHAPGKEMIGLCLEKTHKAVIAVLATLKAGMAWLPLPLDAPPSRIEQIFRACDMGLVLVSKDAANIVTNMSQCIDIDDILASSELQALQGSDLEEISRSSDDLCHILFTSGSTGIPKGVMMEHRAFIHNVRALVKEFALNEKTRTLQFAAMTFDVFSLDVFMTLSCGGCLFMAPLSETIGDLTSSMHKAAITYAHLTPTIILLINPVGVPGLETLVSSGEALSQDIVSHWCHRIHLFNAYGPTETIGCTTQRISGNQVDSACIGQAISGLDVCVLTEQGVQEVREGEVGEICVAGPQLFRGYISSLNEIQSSECHRMGNRYYRTGDLGRYGTNSSGRKSFTLLGRKDDQVKVHGIRVDMGDVESSILTIPSVTQCAVVLPRSGSCAGHLCSIIVLCSSLTAQHPTGAVSQRSCEADSKTKLPRSLITQVAYEAPNVLSALADAKSAVKSRLPAHAIPTNWWVLLELPLTSSGKIDRTKLRTWIEDMEQQTYLEHAKAFSCRSELPNVPSVNSQGRFLQSLWSQVLGRPALSLRTDVSFIELGADSLDVIQFIAKARKSGLKFDLSQVHTARTIEGLAYIQPSEETSSIYCADSSYVPFSLLPRARPLGQILEDSAATCGLQVGKIEDVYPCTPYQSGLMALDLKCPMSYVCAFSWTLLQSLEIDRFRAAWDDLLASEPVLRNRLIWDPTSQDFWQVTVHHEKCEWSIEEFQSPMSLGHTMCRGFVSRDAATEKWKFQLKIHHSIIDGWTLKLMLNRLKSIYFREESVRPATVPFTHFIRFRLEESNRKVLASKEFWNRYLMDFSPSHFLAVQADSSHEVHANSRLSLSIPINMREVATRYEVTPATMLYAAVALVLGAHGDTSDVSFGLILTGRDAPVDGIYEMVGPAFAIVPFRTCVERQKSTARLLKTIARQVIDAIPHQHYGLQDIKGCGAGAAAACELECLVVVQPEDENLAGKGLWDEIHGQTSGIANTVPLSLEFVLDEDQIVVNCNFDPVYLSHDDGKVLLGHFSGVLRSFQCMDPQDIVAKVRFAEDDDQFRALEWAQSNGSPTYACLHEIIQPCFEKYSANIAIEDQATQRRYTYCELDEFSDRLSRRLYTHHAVRPEVIVPVALEKSALAVITILAVLRAGGAYVPIDLSWPLERVRYIVKQTGATIILCSHAGAEVYRDLDAKAVEIGEDSWNDVERNSTVAESIIEATPSNLAIVMYTSGSTGVPKGVMLEHRALSTSLTHLARAYRLTPGTRHLQYSSFVFDVSISDIFIPLLSGACICMPDEYSRVNCLALTIKEMAIESLDLTPSIADLISLEDVTTLKVVTIGGEMMKKSLIERWAPKVRMITGYGLTEASICSTIRDGLDANADPSTVGWNGTAWHWIVRRELDGEIYAAPTGCVGEIAIAGNVLARGYLHNVTLTEQCFVEAPQLTVDRIPSRIYLTGDIGRYDADGQIRIVGRKDRLLKISGVRVEPGESEHQLRQIGGSFRSCVVQCVHDIQHVAKLAAFIEVGASTQEETPKQGIIILDPSADFKTMCKGAHDQLKHLLPSQYVPTLFVPITRMPYLLSGKVDQKRLRDELQQVLDVPSLFGVFQAPDEKSDELLPDTPAQIALEAAIREVFVIEQRIYTSANFFHLGGDSYQAIKMVIAARKNGYEISVAYVYKYPTLGDLASVAVPIGKASPATAQGNHVTFATSDISKKDHYVNKGATGTPKPFSLIKVTDRRSMVQFVSDKCQTSTEKILDIYPCTSLQELLMISSTKNPGAYFNQEVFRLAHRTTAPKLVACLQKIWARHEILRTRIVHDETYRSLQIVINESLNISYVEQNLEAYLQQDASNSPGYGERLSRCAVVTHGRETYLVVSQHHAVYDGWSQNLLFAEICREYSGEYSAITQPTKFPSFVRNVIETNESSNAKQYWDQYLTDFEPRPIPPIKHSFAFEANQMYTMQASLPSSAKHSLAVRVEAAWAVVLARYSDSEDVAFGTVRSGRTASVDKIDTVIGPTIVTIPRRLRPIRDQHIDQYLQCVNTTITKTLPWEQFSYQNIRKLNEGARRACKFSSIVAVQMLPSNFSLNADETIIPHNLQQKNLLRADCLTLQCQPQEDGELIISAIYDDRVISSDDLRWMIYQFSRVIVELSDKNDARVQDLDMAGPRGIEQVRQWNCHPIPESKKLVHDIFSERVGGWATLTAIKASDGTITYGQLDSLSSMVAASLYRLGVRKWDIIPLFMTRTAVMVVAIIGVLKAGAAYAPIAIDSPQERIGVLLEELGAQYVICTPEHESTLRGFAVFPIPYDLQQLMADSPEQGSSAPQTANGNYDKSIIPQDSEVARNTVGTVDKPELAYVIFTSGSSGTPKGVMIGHRAFATTILESGLQIKYSLGTKTLSFSAYTFDWNVLEIFLTLLHGGCLFIPDADQRLGDLSKYINDHQIELAFMTPTAVKNLLHTPSKVPSLRFLDCGGEPLPQSILKEWSTALCLINVYGPTETCIYACGNTNVGPTTDPNNIGYPIGTHLWVTEIGSYDRLAPIGCSGELLISGPKLALGYLNEEEKSRQKFIDGSEIPWKLHNETRFYTSGDIVRQNTDGSITFIGRKDLQTKLNGIRVEIGEVEVALELCGDIAAAVVIKVALQDAGTESLIAFFTTTATRPRDDREDLLPPTDDIQRTIHSVCEKASQSLPTSLVPQIYLPLTKIPITASGKTDRNALHRIFKRCSRDQIASYRSNSVQRPTRTAIQRIIQGLWAQVLSLNPNQISLDSKFISLGGESLAAIKLASLCREIGFHLSISDIFQKSRLEDMASYAEFVRDSRSRSTQRLEASTSSLVNGCSTFNRTPQEISQITDACSIDETDIEDIYPCTAAQEAMTAVTARFPVAYISPELFRVPGNVDLERFQAAWELVSENNPILRTRICSIATDRGIENVQVVCRRRCVWDETALSLTKDYPNMGLGAPLARYRIVRNQDGTFFEMVKHHSIYDGFSEKLIWDDFRYAYTNSARPSPRPSYRQYVDYLSSLNKEEVVKFWAEDLYGYKGEHFPALSSSDYIPQATSESNQTAEVNLHWDDLCPYTFATIARAAWAIILSTRGKMSGPDKDVCFTATQSGRSAPLAGLEHMVGPTINTVPVRVRFNLDQTVDQCLRQIQEHALSMLPFEHLGLSEIGRINDAACDACSSPTLLVVQPPQLQEDILPAGLTRVEDGESLIQTFGLVVECIGTFAQDALSVSASYDSRLLEEKAVGHLLQQFLTMITYLNRNYTSRSTIRSGIWNLVDESSLQQMAEWNPVYIQAPKICLHQLVEKSAELHSHDTAVDAHDGTLTYEKLESAAGALAAHLQNEYGIGPGDIVPLCFEKSRSMIVAILAILKSGAGYTPLDIQGPTARLEHVILKTRAKVVVVSQLQVEAYMFPVPTFILNLEFLTAPSKDSSRMPATAKDIAYVLFTSGTTGTPKGVVTEHGSICLTIQEHTRRYQHEVCSIGLRALQFNSYTFDQSVLDIFGTLAQGGCICIPSEEERMGNLEETATKMKANFAFLTPTVANLLEPSKMPTLKGLAVGGEMLNRVLVTKWMSSESPLDVFINCYGPTEASICCATGVIDPKRPHGHAGKTLGASLWIVDETDIDHLVPVSGIGELVISGPTLARGYLNDDRRTKEAFIEGVPWLARTGHSRLYKTGDLARFDVHGNVEILGRKEDGQIKLRGLRIELGEVEAAISACERLFRIERVAAALVTLDGKPTLSAFIQLPEYDDQTQVAHGLEASMFHKPSDHQRDIANTVVEALRTILPEYMIPKVWILVRSWPLTTAGKTDRRLLMATCEALDSTIIAEYQKSSIIATTTMSSTLITKTEKVIKDVWIDVLRKASNRVIEPEDDFFKLGGDSLDTIKMVSALRSRHIHLNAQEIFRAKTLRRMAEIADSKTSTNEMSKIASSDSSSIQSMNQQIRATTPTSLVGDSSPNYGAANGDINDISSAVTTNSSSSSVEQPSKLSSSTKSFLCGSTSIDQTHIENVLPATRTQLVFLIEAQKWCRCYYAWSFIAVDNACTVARVYDSCQALTKRHAILRTHFHLLERECYQVVIGGAIDFKVLVYNGASKQMCERLDNDVEQPVFFGKLLTRFRLLIEEGTGRQILAIGLSHAQYDGFCLPTILNDLRSGLEGQNSAKLLMPSYDRFIKHALEVSHEEADKFWRETLRDSTITSIVPPAETIPPVMDHNILRLVPFKFKHSGHFSYGVISKAAWSLVLSRLSRSTDVTFGNLVNGRFAAFEGVQDVVGPCINVIPARVRVDGDLRVRGLLEQIQEQQIAAIPFEATPLDRIARQANWPTSMHFATIFQYQYLPNRDTLDTGAASTLAGFATYGGGLLQQNGCWLMAWPEADGQAPFRLGFCGETMSQSRAETILDLLSKTLHAINDNLDDNVQNILSLPIDETLHCPQTPCPGARNIPQPSPTVTAALAVIVDCLQPIWTQVLRPLLPPPPSQPDLDTLNLDHNSSFFSLGGDSIAAAEAVWLCSKAGLDLNLQDFMDFPTLALQAALVAGQVQRPEREKPRLKFIDENKAEYL